MKIENCDKLDRRKAFLINAAYWALIALAVFLALKYVVGLVMPLIIGFVVAFCLNPAIKLIMRKTGLRRGLIASVVVIFCYAVLGTLLILLSIWLFGRISDFVVHMPEYYDNYILPTLKRIEDFIVSNGGMLVPNWNPDGTGSSLLGEITNFILSFSSSAITFLTGFTARLPMVLLACIFTILSSLFMSIYYNGFVGFVLKQLPPRARSLVLDVRRALTDTVSKYLVAYLKIMGITFVELAVGLTILRVPMSLLVALGIAFFDILPVLGTGGILAPWIIWSLINQDYIFALGMTILYIVVLLVRNFVEPKIVGDQLGMNPLLAVASIYVGLVTMGFAGVLIVPVTVQIILTLHRQGKVSFLKF